jgi:hypothetical protein
LSNAKKLSIAALSRTNGSEQICFGKTI